MSNLREYDNANPYIQYSASASAQPGKKDWMREALGRCGKTLEGYGKMAEEAADDVWNHKDKMWEALGRCGKMLEEYGKMAEEAADDVWNHIKVSPSIGDTARARIIQGTKLLTKGGPERLFQHTFGVIPGEKYLHSYACYLSTSSGPVNGTLYISTKRVAFSSESPLCYSSTPGQPQWMYYKVVIELDRVATINPSPNLLNPSEKDILVVTRDGHEFWFMGFLLFNWALKSLNEALKHSRV